MLTSLAASRTNALVVVALAFLCSLLLATEYEMVAVGGVADSRRGRLHLEELLLLSGVFSTLLAVIAFVNHKLARRERVTRALAEREANLDPLTGLANRRLFNDRLGQALRRSRDGEACAVLLIDVDRFKQINDEFGHAAGDFVLVELAERIASFAAAPNDAARLGGDEFALILERGDSEQGQAGRLVAELAAALSQPLLHKGRTITPAASIGIAFASPGSTRSADLLHEADLDMYRNKAARRDQLTAFPHAASRTG